MLGAATVCSVGGGKQGIVGKQEDERGLIYI